MKIYHFTNFAYGLPFLGVYDNLPRALISKIHLTIVYSREKDRPSKYFLISVLKRKIREYKLRKDYRKRFKDLKVKIIFSNNVNGEVFIKKIPENCIGICAGFNQIFSNQLIGKFKTCINIHPSLLPFYRGPVPSYWVLKNQEKTTGFTIHRMTKKIDFGEILYQKEVAVDQNDTEDSLDQKIALQARGHLRDFIIAQLSGESFVNNILEPGSIYKYLVGYKSFPR